MEKGLGFGGRGFLVKGSIRVPAFLLKGSIRVPVKGIYRVWGFRDQGFWVLGFRVWGSSEPLLRVKLVASLLRAMEKPKKS